MSKYPPKLQELLDSLSFIEDKSERINLLIDFAERFKEIPRTLAARPFPEDKKVEYCESEAYVWVFKNENGSFNFQFAVENPHGISAKALAVILKETLENESIESILTIDSDLVLKIFGESLSMGKNLGLTGILLHLKKELLTYR
jgi:sulfur transfer protein SufE